MRAIGVAERTEERIFDKLSLEYGSIEAATGAMDRSFSANDTLCIDG